MEVRIAEHSGFCFGVQRAIDMAFAEAMKDREGCSIYTCGPLIHNRSVTEYLEQRGVGMIDSLDEAKAGDTVIVRSHGEPKEFYEKASSMGINLVDTTCVFVAKIHSFVEEAYSNGREVIIVGSKVHPEVTATNGWCNYSAAIIENTDDAENYIKFNSVNNPLIVAQTTFKEETLKDILCVFDREGKSYELKNTICNATRERQESCAKLAAEVDAMVVIGDSKSSNSRKLFEIAKKYNKNSIFVQDKCDNQFKK